MKKSDEEIIIDYLNGDRDAFNEIVNRYLKAIYNFTYRFVRDEKTAEDITQETFLKTWKNLKKFKMKKSFKTWIFSIAKNTSIDHLRKRKDVQISAFDNEEGGNFIEDNLKDVELKPDEIFALSQDKKQIEKIISELSIVQKQVIILKYTNEMPLSEIAEIMDIPIDTAKSHHRRALLRMRKLLSAPKLLTLTYKQMHGKQKSII
jgi:RNA polymerase sigma-70 factor, ECF subfamily